MITDNSGLDLVDQLVDDLKSNETRAQKKANTVTTAIGSIATFLAAGLTALVESGTDLPSWFPFIVVFVGMVATTYGVSKTKNGITDSVADKLHTEIARKIDENHFHSDEDVTQIIPLVSDSPEDDVYVLRRWADQIVDRLPE